MEQIYFLESVVVKEENVNNHIVLFNASALLKNGNLNPHELFTDRIIYNRNIHVNFLSGFVKFENDHLISANNTYVARHYIFQNNAIRHFVMHNSTDVIKDVDTLEEVFSYHINVGHGNCTFIISGNTIIAVDCSNFDCLNKKNYQNNIDSCINYILTKFRLKVFHIDYFILTHSHYDHYSGINKLIDKGYIDKTTTFYMNIYYSMPSPTFNTTLQNIYRCGCSIIEPITRNSNNIIDIIYPDRRLVKTGLTVYNALNPIIDKKPNNSSVVVRIIGKDKSFTFTGDIETTAWNRVVGCYPYFKNTDYFAISNHGSINGYIRKQCPANQTIKQISDCIGKCCLQVIMGRKGVYNNIPSKDVLMDFPNVVFSEYDEFGNTANYLEIEWSTGAQNWY